jgi:hypothetical protein
MDVEGESLFTTCSLDVHWLSLSPPPPTAVWTCRRYSFLQPGVWTCRVSSLLPPAVWTCRVNPYPQPAVCMCSVLCALCRVYAFPPPAVWTCRVYYPLPPPAVWMCIMHGMSLSSASIMDVQGVPFFKGIFQPFELGGMTRLIQSAVKFCKAGR